MPNIWASECIHYFNLIYEKVWSIGKVTLNYFPQGLVLFLDCAVLFLKSHVCITRRLCRGERLGLSGAVTVRAVPAVQAHFHANSSWSQ